MAVFKLFNAPLFRLIDEVFFLVFSNAKPIVHYIDLVTRNFFEENEDENGSFSQMQSYAAND